VTPGATWNSLSCAISCHSRRTRPLASRRVRPQSKSRTISLGSKPLTAGSTTPEPAKPACAEPVWAPWLGVPCSIPLISLPGSPADAKPTPVAPAITGAPSRHRARHLVSFWLSPAMSTEPKRRIHLDANLFSVTLNFDDREPPSQRSAAADRGRRGLRQGDLHARG